MGGRRRREGTTRESRTRAVQTVLVNRAMPVAVASLIVAIFAAKAAPWWVVAPTAAGALLGFTVTSIRQHARKINPFPGNLARLRSPHDRRYIVPHQIPPAPADFHGRDQELRKIRDLLADSQDGQAPIVLIIGPAGVGKTALAIQFAAQHWHLFPDGQLFAMLGHQGSQGAPELALLGEFAKAVGFLDDQIPRDFEGLRHHYLKLTNEWRGLVVIDDACHIDCVKQLLPAGRNCAAIITSRDDLTGLRARRINLSPLQENEAMDLLESVIGEERVQSDRNAALKIAAGGHPLSVRLSAGALVTRPYLPLHQAVARMEEQRPLPRETPGAVLAGKLDLAYALLTLEERKALRCIGLFEQPVISPWQLAALLGIENEDATRLADNLAQAQFTQRTSGGRAGIVRFETHDHVLEYAHARMLAETLEDKRRQRLDALDTAHAARRGSADQLELHLSFTIPAWKDEGRLDKALDEARDALAIAEESGRVRETALALALLADLQVELGNTDEAMEMAQDSLLADVNHRPIRALRCLGTITRRVRQLDLSERYLAEAATNARAAGSVTEEIRTLIEQSTTFALTAEPSRSVTTAEEAVGLCRTESGQLALLTGAQWALGNAMLSCGRVGDALPLLDGAALAASDDQALWRAWVYWLRSMAALDAGELGAAAASAAQGIDLFGAMAHRYGVAYCKLALGRVYVTDTSRINDAVALLTDALETFQNCNDVWTQGDAKHVLGQAMIRANRRSEALRLLQDAERTFTGLPDMVSREAVRRDLESLPKGIKGRGWGPLSPELPIGLRKGN
jgi:tetratricopeptide (TPR) repeat protein